MIADDSRRECVILVAESYFIAKYNPIIDKWMIAQPYPTMEINPGIVDDFRYIDEMFNE